VARMIISAVCSRDIVQDILITIILNIASLPDKTTIINICHGFIFLQAEELLSASPVFGLSPPPNNNDLR
jgi:hypothetical protein